MAFFQRRQRWFSLKESRVKYFWWKGSSQHLFFFPSFNFPYDALPLAHEIFFYPPAIKREREGCVGRKLPKDSLSPTALSQKERDFMGGLPIYRILPFFFWVGNLSMWRLLRGGQIHTSSHVSIHTKLSTKNTFEATLCLLPRWQAGGNCLLLILFSSSFPFEEREIFFSGEVCGKTEEEDDDGAPPAPPPMPRNEERGKGNILVSSSVRTFHS